MRLLQKRDSTARTTLFNEAPPAAISELAMLVRPGNHLMPSRGALIDDGVRWSQ